MTISSISPADILLVAGVAAALCWVVLVGLWLSGRSRESVLVPLLVALWIAAYALRDSVELSATLGGVHVSAFDVLSALLLITGVLRLLALTGSGLVRGFVAALLALFVVHLVRGVVSYGIQPAVNDARPWLYFLGALTFAATIPARQSRQAWIVLIAAGVLLILIAIPNVAVDGIRPSYGTRAA